MDIIASVPAIWGDRLCVVLPNPPKGDSTKWNVANVAWVQKLLTLSPENPEPDPNGEANDNAEAA